MRGDHITTPGRGRATEGMMRVTIETVRDAAQATRAAADYLHWLSGERGHCRGSCACNVCLSQRHLRKIVADLDQEAMERATVGRDY